MTTKNTLFYAHSTQTADKSNWQPLKEHLSNVGSLAEEFADAFNCADYGKAAGLLHDLGKYTDEFQRRLEGLHPKVDHATWGAKIALEKYGDKLSYLITYAIAGHHAGLANGAYRDDQRLTPLTERCNKTNLPVLKSAWKHEIEQQLPNKLPVPPLKPKNGFSFFQYSFLSRMILSCLVDADRLDTEDYENRVAGKSSSRGQYPALAQLKVNFDQAIQSFKADNKINRKRADILRAVRHNARTLEPGLFSLTVPTGGGKTLASMAFALDHAEAHQKRRIIYVIPFTSIIEQNAAVFRDKFGAEYQDAVIEHHSAFNDADIENNIEQPDSRTKLKMAMENWDAPIIVTTAVQFMESLFSNRPSQCRKLHRIANSVVILDEAQTLPMHLLRPCLEALDELHRNYGCSIVLCTATQPAFKAEDGFPGGLQNVRELARSDDGIDPKQLYKQFQRVTVQHIGELDDANVIARLSDARQILCIVNTRKQAQLLYQGIKDLPGSYHLSTYMYAAHRKAVLAEIRQALKDGKPCRVVSTSLIEAGVDVDFPCVMRSDAGLDSIAQAAGRCNRENERPKAESPVWIFTAKGYRPPPELKTYADKMNETLSISEFGKDPLGLAAIQDYFTRVYWHHETGQTSQLDKHGILTELQNCKLNNMPFEWIGKTFKIIDSPTKTAIVLRDDAARDCIERLKNLPDGVSVGPLARALQIYTISIWQHWVGGLLGKGVLQYVQPERFGEQFLVLIDNDFYDGKMGFNPEADPFIMKGDDCNW